MHFTGFEFRLWRRGLNWTQERTVEELGISLRTYKNYEKSFPPLMAELATEPLSLRYDKSLVINRRARNIEYKRIRS